MHVVETDTRALYKTLPCSGEKEGQREVRGDSRYTRATQLLGIELSETKTLCKRVDKAQKVLSPTLNYSFPQLSPRPR